MIIGRVVLRVKVLLRKGGEPGKIVLSRAFPGDKE